MGLLGPTNSPPRDQQSKVNHILCEAKMSNLRDAKMYHL